MCGGRVSDLKRYIFSVRITRRVYLAMSFCLAISIDMPKHFAHSNAYKPQKTVTPSIRKIIPPTSTI